MGTYVVGANTPNPYPSSLSYFCLQNTQLCQCNLPMFFTLIAVFKDSTSTILIVGDSITTGRLDQRYIGVTIPAVA